jgi:hypothetical protein
MAITREELKKLADDVTLAQLAMDSLSRADRPNNWYALDASRIAFAKAKMAFNKAVDELIPETKEK